MAIRPIGCMDGFGKVTGVTVLGSGDTSSWSKHTSGAGYPRSPSPGLPGAAVQDARDRIRPALESSGLEWPLRRAVVNLSPGNLRKEGPGLDLPVAMSVLTATAGTGSD